jgi:23S rRNA (guanosine2251-2'-O)-methyltransferase
MAQYIYGKNTVKQRLQTKTGINKLILNKANPWKEGEALAIEQRIPIEYADAKKMDQLAQGNHQGAMIEIDDFKTYTLDEILKSAQKDAVVVLLDGLEDPHNLGAILRSADAAGIDGIILPKHRSVSLTPTVAKVSTGAIDTVKTCEVTNLNQTIKDLKKAGFWIYGTGMGKDARDYRTVDYKGKIALVIGSEGTGISRLVKENCDFVVNLPMHGSIQSLNASVAAGILFYEVLNQRFPAK